MHITKGASGLFENMWLWVADHDIDDAKLDDDSMWMPQLRFEHLLFLFFCRHEIILIRVQLALTWLVVSSLRVRIQYGSMELLQSTRLCISMPSTMLRI